MSTDSLTFDVRSANMLAKSSTAQHIIYISRSLVLVHSLFSETCNY